ncbi:MAG: HupE/UreJ family protein [Hyphomicrobiaceae bacterium]|nr:HupE/UreJ family protein [Hyphomicrobiaceae bacterium]
MNRTKLVTATVLSLLIMTDAAFAHTGHATSGLVAGLTHPMVGLDHLLAMLAVGVWAAQQPTSRAWAGPAVFVVLLAVGAGLGLAGIAVPLVEPGILASVVLFGVMIVAGRHLPAGAGLAMIGGFALLHGHAHGTEAVGTVTSYMAGFIAASALLHVAGFAFGRSVALIRYGVPATGLALMAAGVALAGA